MLKLYVWQHVLRDWKEGFAFALAESEDQAKRLIIESGLEEGQWEGIQLDGQYPSAYDAPVGFHQYGGG